MRPSHLKYPFVDGRKKEVLLLNKVLFVPEKGIDDYSSYQLPAWNSDELFGNNHPVNIEYCSGNGAWIAAKALENPECNWVAVEKKFDRVRRIWAKMHNFNLSNLLVIYGEASLVTKTYFPKKTFAQTYINFPDPWPKRRHAKFRLIQPSFIELIHDSLNGGGEVYIATDDETYSNSIIKDFSRNQGFASRFADPYFIHDFPGYGTSYFEELWRSQGLKIRYHCFKKSETA